WLKVSDVVALATPTIPFVVYGERPMLWPLPPWPEIRPIARVTLTSGLPRTAVACDAPLAKLAVPVQTVELSLSSIACQAISSMLSGDPVALRSKVSVVELVSCVRTRRDPMSAPVPLVRQLESTNVLRVLTAVSVAVADV